MNMSIRHDRIEDMKKLYSFVPYTSATSSPVAVTNNQLVKLPNPSQSHMNLKRGGQNDF